MRWRLIILSFVAALFATATGAQTPNANLLRMNGGIHPAYYCDYTQGAFCGGESYSTTSQRWMFDATGAITYAPNNLLKYSNTFSNAAWTLGAVSVASGAADPFGGTSAWTFTNSSTTAEHRLYQETVSASTNSAVNFNLVGYAKAGTASFLALSNGNNTDPYVVFNLSNGTVASHYLSAAYSIVSVGNGWYALYAKTTAALSAYFVMNVGTSAANAVPEQTYLGSGETVYFTRAVFSFVTYEIAPRAQDQSITTSAVYYGPALPDHNPATLASLGYRSEAAATNLYLNSGAPATQTIIVANATQYTGSIRQTGTQAFTGAFTATLTGAANTTTQTTQTSATTSLVATDTSLAATAYPQVEAGAFATSPIITGASAVTRAADSVTLAGALAALKVTNPIIVERQSEATGAISRTLYAANTFAFATGYWYRKLAAYPVGTPTAILNQIAAMQRPMR